RGTLDALSAHIAVVDADGKVVLTNRAYREFAQRNEGVLESVAEGSDYLLACHEAKLRGSSDGEIFEGGLRAVLAGALPSFAHEYACHSPEEERWFVGRATPVRLATDPRVWSVIAHENITERHLAERDLQSRLAFESLMAELAARFVGATQDDALDEVEVALGRLLENLELGRASYWRRPDGEPGVMRLQCQARSDETLAMGSGLDARVAFPWVVERLETIRAPLVIDDVDLLPPEAAVDKAALDKMGIHASVVLPQFDRDGVLTGSLAFSVTTRRVFERGLVSRLQMFTNLVHELFARLDTERALIASLEERQRLQEQLTQAQKLESIGRLAGGVAHDFNNLMMGIMGYTEAAREELEPGHPAREWLDDILKESERSVNLVRQLLAFARKQTLQPRHLDLNTQIEGMTRMLRRLIGERIALVWSPAPARHTVYTDPTHVDQILANLCVNAADAITGHGTITIATRFVVMDTMSCQAWPEMTPGPYVLLSISDTGCGMDEATRARAFEPFFTTKGVGRGTGLGLSTVYGVVKQSNGFIYIESAPGAGTTFRIFFPATDRLATELVAEAATDLPGGHETILLVEDEHSIRSMLARHLARLGYQIFAAEHPEEALAHARAHPGPIDLLLSDIVMPGMSGIELQRALESLQPSVKTVLMTGYAAEALPTDSGPRTGQTRRLEKPVPLATLAGTIRSLLDEADEQG
ncbi:MAG TPA: ATP-binding protein, partial [Myxococcota bacterium]|nr:ATP-binding protein [Myxococcota bacterium]